MKIRRVLSLCAVLFVPVTLFAQWLPSGAGNTTAISHNASVTVGSDTINSTYMLDVNGTTRLGGNVFLGSPTFGIGTLYLWPDTSGSYIHGTGTGIDLVAMGGTVQITNGNTVIAGYNPPSSPATTALTVKGSTTTSTSTALNVTDVGGASLMFVRNDGLVGVGTSTPKAKVHAYAATGPVAIRAENGDIAGTNATMAVDNVIGPYLVSHSDTAGLSTAAFAAHRVTFGAGSFAVAYSPATAAGAARTWSNQLTVDPSGAVSVSGSIKGNSHLAFMPWTNGAGSPVNGYVRLLTPIADHESNIFSLHIYGYTYQGDTSSFDIRCSGYAYSDPTNGGLINKSCTTMGIALPVEITTEPAGTTNNVVVRIGTTSTYWYYPHLALEYDGWQPKDPAGFVWSVQSSVPPGAPALTNMNNVAIADVNGGSIVVGQPGAVGTRLTVHGDAVVDGNFAAKYQDVAEWVPADASLAPGTVVVLDRRAANRVTASTHAYDVSVAGVVSAMPGVILGEAGANKAQIATTGRVRVNVDASHGAIGIGDLLVTSDTPGFAMKSEPLEVQGRSFHQPGTLIGKALEPLAGGKGEILVLLSLQ